MPRRSLSEMIPDLTNEIIDDGRLLLLNLLGQGAFSKVYRAIDTANLEDKRTYAVKCLWRLGRDNKNARHQLRELSLHELVSSHPNIVTIHKVISDERFVYVIMELAETSLFDIVTRDNNPFTETDKLAKDTFVAILDAIAYCHNKGVYHRDLKPENIMCKLDGTAPLVADFGLSTTSTSSRDFGCGTRRYYSPECLDHSQSKKSYEHGPNDVWSLGIILLNMVVRRHPWKAASAEDECYDYYFHHRDWLFNVFPISHEAHDLFNAIFDPDPSTRIQLPELRKRVLQISTFFRLDPLHLPRSFSAMTTDYETSSSGPRSYHPMSPIHFITPASYPFYAASTRVFEFSDDQSDWGNGSQGRASETRLSMGALFRSADTPDGDSASSVMKKSSNVFVKFLSFKTMFQKLVLKS